MNQLFIPREWSMLKKLLAVHALTGSSSLVEDTATGNPLTFITDVSKPLKSLLIPFTPQQEGTGDPSPSNIRSILPWDGFTVFGGGKNLFNISDLIGETGITVSGNEITSRMYRLFNLGTVDLVDSIPQGTTFKVAFKAYTDGSYTTSGVGLNIQIVDTNGNSTTVVRINNNVLEETYFNVSITAEAEIIGIKFGYNSGNENIWHIKGLVIGEADVYQSSFPSSVYGGTLDVVSGELTVEWAEIASYNGETLPGEWLSDRDVYSAGTTPTIGAQVVYKLAEPQEQTLTGHQITALIGNNTIWSDANGSMTCVYLVSSKYAEEHPVGGLGSGLGSGLLGSGTVDNPDEPTEPDEPIEEPVENGQEEGDTE